jgi:hypothetical protein
MSKEIIRTFLIMSHGSWPEKQINTDSKGRQFARNGKLQIDGFYGFNSTTHTIGGTYENIEETEYIIPQKTRLFTTTNYGNLAIACPKYDIFIKKYIGQYGTNIFTSPRLIDSLSQKYEFIKNSRLYTDSNKIVDIDITFEEDKESWNIWEKTKYGLTKVPNLDLTQKYRLSDLIDFLTLTEENDGIAVPNQRTRIILHCCMPNIANWSWNENEYKELYSKVNLMMNRGSLNIKTEHQRNKFLEKKTKKLVSKKKNLRSGVISRNNQVRRNKLSSKQERLLRKGWISYYTPKKNTLSYKSQRKNPTKFKIGIRKTNTRMKK